MISRRKIQSFLRVPYIDGDLEKKIQYCEVLIEESIRPRWVKRRAERVDFLSSAKSLTDLMEAAEALTFVAITLGNEAEVLLQRTESKDRGLAFILDAALSAYVEDCLDRIQGEGREKTDLYITDRYSPGYGDIPLSLQRDFADFLNIYQRLGLTLTEENLLIPRKSVLALYGKVRKKPSYRTDCSFCRRSLCQDSGKARCSRWKE